MDPLTLGLMSFGAIGQIGGAILGMGTAHQTAEVSMDVAKQEQGINDQKKQQMQLQAQRSQLENFRNIQRARAQGLNAATSQGAQFGTGLIGGQDQATDQGAYNALGINQNLTIGNKIAGYNDTISQDKIQLAQLGGQAATDQGLSSLGGALMKIGPTVGQIGQGWSFSGGTGFGNYSGTPGASNTGGLY